MKKLFFSMILVFAGVAAQAEIPLGYTKVPGEQMETYQKAVVAAMNENPDSHLGCDTLWINQTFQYLTEIYVSSTSAQPLLLFDAHYVTSEDILQRMVITTDPSLKKITEVAAEVYKMGEVNKGDLAHPVIVHDYILVSHQSCLRKP